MVGPKKGDKLLHLKKTNPGLPAPVSGPTGYAKMNATP